MSQKHSSSRSYVQARDLNRSLQVSVFAHRCAKLWNCQTHVEFTHVLWYEVIPMYVRLSDGDWSIGACRLFCSLWLKTTEQSTCATSYLSTLQNINHLEGAIFTIAQLPFVKHRQECQYFNHFVSSCILNDQTLLPVAFTGMANVYNDNGGTELAMGWNSTELVDLLLKAKFLTFQTT